MLEQLLLKEYTRVQTLPEDREGTIPMAKQTSNSSIFLKLFPIGESELMPANQLGRIVDGIHNCLAENQGLIDVDSKSTKVGNATLVYSIIKTIGGEGIQSGATYTLRLQYVSSEKWEIVGFFQETGITGQRDTTVYSYLKNNNYLEDDNSNWMRDPFDENYTHGIPMNMSELDAFDDSFPEHPLSQCRRLINLIEENL